MQAATYLDQRGPLAIAHRGGTEAAPENTLAAFASAVSVGYRYLETDVHVTSDGVVVAFHDDELDRVTNGVGRIADLRWADVSSALIAGAEPIPTLAELLEAFPEHRFNIDSKSDDVVVPLVAVLQEHDALDRVCLAAFSDERLRRLRALVGPSVCTAASPKEVTSLVLASRTFGSRQRARAYQCLQVPVRHQGVEVVTAAFIDQAHRDGVQVHVWTVNEPDEMNRLLDLGIDGIITDLPTVLREVLASRGAWI